MNKDNATAADLKNALANSGVIGNKVLNNEATGEQYRQALLVLKEIMITIAPEEVIAAGYPSNIESTIKSDQHLLLNTLTEELNQLSLLCTLSTYVDCNSEGRPGHNVAYMDKVTALRKVIEAVYGEEAIRFCGRDGCR